MDLEANCDLNPNLPAHIWLLHHLFLASVDQDAKEWAHAWNNHTLQLRGERNRSPKDMYFFSMYQDGPRGVQYQTVPSEEEIEDVENYGVDWEDAEDPVIMDHLHANNPQDRGHDEDNPFHSTTPSSFSDVPCEPPNCPLTPQQVHILDTVLPQRVNLSSRSMVTRHMVWEEALSICNNIWTILHE